MDPLGGQLGAGEESGTNRGGRGHRTGMRVRDSHRAGDGRASAERVDEALLGINDPLRGGYIQIVLIWSEIGSALERAV